MHSADLLRAHEGAGRGHAVMQAANLAQRQPRLLKTKMQISKTEQEVAGELVELTAAKLGSDRAVHPETAIASCARLAGSLLLRSFSLNLENMKPGSVVLSNEANVQGQQLLGLFAGLLENFGVALDREKLGGESSMSGNPSKLSIVESLSLLQEEALRISRARELPLERAAVAAAMATAFISRECVKSVGAEVGFKIAALGFVEGCKTVPPRTALETRSRDAKPWYKLW